ncbi:MAG: acetyltransferase [Nitrospiraceae bacterium]|nr:acetyltransferase [Nitrospiraceae bacterium]
MTKLERYLRLGLYYGFLRHLPKNNVPLGKLCDKARYLVCAPLFKRCGKLVNIRKGADFGQGDQLSIGNSSDLGPNCRVVGNVEIGNHVGIAFDVFISSMTRELRRTDVPLAEAGAGPDGLVVIEDDVVILARAMILAGVRVHSHTLIGGGAVVSKDVPSGAVVAGNPARIVNWRTEPDPNYDPKTMTPLSEKMQRKWDEERGTDG